jgi:NAD+ synthase (glutamine-hydrolysing)
MLDSPTPTANYTLPELIANAQGSTTVPFGDATISSMGMSIGTLTYDDLVARKSPQKAISKRNPAIHTVSAANDHHLGAFSSRFFELQEACRETGGIFLYANQRGCDGDRIYYEGCAMILVNGELVAQGSQFSLQDVETITAAVDLDDIEAYRTSKSHNVDLDNSESHQRIELQQDLCCKRNGFIAFRSSQRIAPKIYNAHEEIGMGPACWLWDYLRRSNAVGFLVPLSGGIDSCSTATIVFSMCRIVVDTIRNGNAQVEADVQRITGAQSWLPKTPQDLCHRILHTVYMGVGGISSQETRCRARRLAQDIGAYHTDMNIDSVYHAEKNLLGEYLGYVPRFDGGPAENLALQNIQARIRMVTAYYFAQMLPSTRGRASAGTLLVLGSVGVEECLRGNLTKHDCSSADLSPIGSFSKMEIRQFMQWARTEFTLPILEEFLSATPTAELEPSRFGQCDAKDMGMTHHELCTFAKLRKEMRLGPVSMFQQLLSRWRGEKTPADIAQVVKKFHYFYGINRHKMSTMTPAYHAGKTNPDNSRFDMRPLLYPGFEGSWSCKRIDGMAKDAERKLAKPAQP